jgi:aminoglycoside phosphotransferase (APT) family kinase protein
LQADDLVVLENIVSQYEILESYWSQVEEFCEGLPPTLVHGDFTGKNLRVRTGRAGIALLSFDWEMAGWGVPATDLAQSALRGSGGFSANPDIVTYWSVVRDHWPSLDLQTIQRLANCGKMFRSLAAIDWRAQDLAYDVKWAMSDMRIYQVELVDAIQAASWRQ